MPEKIPKRRFGCPVEGSLLIIVKFEVIPQKLVDMGKKQKKEEKTEHQEKNKPRMFWRVSMRV